jgi:integrase
MRRSELARLRASDVDFEHGLITVRGKKTTAAKRQVPIEPALSPLLQVLCHERKVGPLLDAPRADGKGGASDLTKKALERAKLSRADLFRDGADHMPFTFHGFRHTCITHWVVAGRNQLWLLLIAGHVDVSMTRRDLGKAEVLRATFGAPHPLPASVLGGATVVPFPRTA